MSHMRDFLEGCFRISTYKHFFEWEAQRLPFDRFPYRRGWQKLALH